MNETQASQLPVYAGNDLGAVWRSSATAFRLWAPTACSAALHRFATGTDAEPEAADLGTLAMQRSEGGTWYLELAGDLAGQYYQYELQFPDGTSTVTADPYAHAAGAGGTRSMVLNQAAAVPDGWQKDERPAIPAHARSVWEVHVADFTADPASGVPQAYRGKFMGFTVDGTTLNGDGVHPTGLNYLKRLGVTHVQLQPIFDFATVDEVSGEDYNWGYDPLNYNLPEGSYATDAFHGEVRVRECRAMVQALHSAGLGVVMDVVYNHTYYSNSWLERTVPGYWNRRWENGSLTNGSGCGCDLASERTMVRKYLVDSCVYWATEYHIDGFRFDLASIMARNEDGAPMSKPPLLQSLAFDPILGNVKLIAEAWDAGGLYQVGSFPSWNRWAEWNGRYRDDMRRHIKGDQGMAQAAALRIAGSRDIYADHDRKNASVNFITCHDGFTLYDLFSYNVKHNEPNGWNNTDGANDNNSWNCGAEGETDDPQVEALRRRMVRNACALLMCSRGIPMFLAGDEFCNTQFGNNNAYCQDNEISWLNWERLGQYKDIFCFFQYMIRFRKTHRLVRTNVSDGACGFPDVSFHGVKPWCASFAEYERYVGVMFAGQEEGEGPRTVYIASNAYWEPLDVKLPVLPDGMEWELAADTWENVPCPGPLGGNEFRIRPRTVMVMVGK